MSDSTPEPKLFKLTATADRRTRHQLLILCAAHNCSMSSFLIKLIHREFAKAPGYLHQLLEAAIQGVPDITTDALSDSTIEPPTRESN